MESGQWKVDSGKWTVENGKWKMDNGKWKNGKWKMEKEKWKVENGKSTNQSLDDKWCRLTTRNITRVCPSIPGLTLTILL